MGWFGTLVDKVREGFLTDKDRKALEIQRGRQTYRDLAGAAFSSGVAGGFDRLADSLRLEHDLMSRYIDCEDMDDFPELSSALDIYADDATQIDSMRRRTVWCVSDDERTRRILDELLHDTLRIEEDVWSLTRVLAKYGNEFAEILLGKDGVIGLNFLPPPTMRRIEDTNGSLLGFVQTPNTEPVSMEEFKRLLALKQTPGTDQTQGSHLPMDKVAFEDWEVVHWRLRSKAMRSIYGHGVMEAARWVWKRLVLLEDSVVLHKLTRAPGRFAFYIDTGDLAPAQALAYVEQIKTRYKKKKFVDSHGKLDFKMNPLGVDEDYWIPVRSGKESTRIESIAGADWQALDDVQYFREKLFAAIKVPPSYMGIGGEATRASLSQEDVRFARSVLRLQREVRNGLKKVCRVHMIARGLDPNATKWDLAMTVPSSIFELAQLEVRTTQAQLGTQLVDFFDKHWIRVNVFGLSDEEALDVGDDLLQQQKQEGALQAEIQMQGSEMTGEPMPGEETAVSDVVQGANPEGPGPSPDELQKVRDAAKEKMRTSLDKAADERAARKQELLARKQKKLQKQTPAESQMIGGLSRLSSRIDMLAESQDELRALLKKERGVAQRLNYLLHGSKRDRA